MSAKCLLCRFEFLGSNDARWRVCMELIVNKMSLDVARVESYILINDRLTKSFGAHSKAEL